MNNDGDGTPDTADSDKEERYRTKLIATATTMMMVMNDGNTISIQVIWRTIMLVLCTTQNKRHVDDMHDGGLFLISTSGPPPVSTLLPLF